MSPLQVRCALCAEVVSDDDAYSRHLDEVHSLTDDDGTTTTLEQAALASGGSSVVEVAPEEDLAPATPTAIPWGASAVDSSRVFDPDGDDDRWRPIVIGVAGLLLVVVVAVAALFL